MNSSLHIFRPSDPESEQGQAMVEYGLILALVAAACVVVLGEIGTHVVNLYNTVLPFP